MTRSVILEGGFRYINSDLRYECGERVFMRDGPDVEMGDRDSIISCESMVLPGQVEIGCRGDLKARSLVSVLVSLICP